ncbi:MAG: YciI family protein [Alphaproteobacteria bacterium]
MSQAKRVPKLTEHTFVFTCMDGPETKEPRKQFLLGHLDHIAKHNDKYRAAGPLKDTPDGEIIGSIFLVAADTKDEAWDIMRGDPYIKAEMYASVTVHHFTPACGHWMGGVIWDHDEVRTNMKKYT